MRKLPHLLSTVLLFAGLPAFGAPLANTLWFSGDPIYPPDWGNQVSTAPSALTVWQQFSVTDPNGWDITDVYSIGQDFTNTPGEWSIRTGMGVGNAGTVFASGTGTLIESPYSIRTVMDINIVSLYLPQGDYWLEVAPGNGSISGTNGANSIGTTPGNGLRNWPSSNQNYIDIGVVYSAGVAGTVGTPEPATWMSLAFGLGAVVLRKRRSR